MSTRHLDRLITRAATTRAPALCVVVDGKERRAVAVDPRDGSPISSNHLFNFGSIAKTFTATVVAGLAADGAIDLNGSIRDAVPGSTWLPNVTFAALACHHSGLPREPRRNGNTSPEVHTVDALHAAVVDAPTRPGPYQYSNLGYLVLAYTIAQSTGHHLPELVRTKVLEPLRMASTAHESELPTHPRGVRIDTGRPVADRTLLPGASGYYGTVTDLGRWARALLDPPDQLRAAVACATHPRVALRSFAGVPETWTTPAPAGSRHLGLAWRVENNGLIWHTGGTNGYTAFCSANRRTGTTVAALLAAGVGALPDSARSVPHLIRLIRLRDTLKRLAST